MTGKGGVFWVGNGGVKETLLRLYVEDVAGMANVAEKLKKSVDSSVARWQRHHTHGIKLKTHEKQISTVRRGSLRYRLEWSSRSGLLCKRGWIRHDYRPQGPVADRQSIG